MLETSVFGAARLGSPLVSDRGGGGGGAGVSPATLLSNTDCAAELQILLPSPDRFRSGPTLAAETQTDIVVVSECRETVRGTLEGECLCLADPRLVPASHTRWECDTLALPSSYSGR